MVLLYLLTEFFEVAHESRTTLDGACGTSLIRCALLASQSAFAVEVLLLQGALDLVPARLGHVLVRLVHEAVRAQDLLGLPPPVAVVIVQREEGIGVEVGDVVFLFFGGEKVSFKLFAAAIEQTYLLKKKTKNEKERKKRMIPGHTGHVFGHPVGIFTDQRLLR